MPTILLKFQIPCRYPSGSMFVTFLVPSIRKCCSSAAVRNILMIFWYTGDIRNSTDALPFCLLSSFFQCVALSTEHLFSLMVSGSDDSQLVLWWVRASASLSEKVFCKRKWWGFFYLQSVLFSWLFSCMSFIDSIDVVYEVSCSLKFNCPYTSTSVCLGWSTLFLSATSGF